MLAGQAAARGDPHRQPPHAGRGDERIVAQPRRVPRRAPHRVGVVATGVEHRQADRLTHARRGQVQVTGHRAGEPELVPVIGRENQRRVAAHRQTHDGVAGPVDAVRTGEEVRQVLGEEGLPLVGVTLTVEVARRIPVRVEAGLAAHRHHDVDAVVGQPRGVRLVLPPAHVVGGAQTVEQIHGLVAAVVRQPDTDLDLADTARRGHPVLPQAGVRVRRRGARAGEGHGER